MDTGNTFNRFNLSCFEIDSAYHDIAVRLGLSDSAMMILYTLCTMGEACPLCEIIRLSGMKKQTVSSCLARLSADGVISLSKTDGKRKVVCLTEKGRGLANKTVYPLMKEEQRILSSWKSEELELYLKLNDRFLSQIKELSQTIERSE